jgi:SAM-dependent methyltransferase
MRSPVARGGLNGACSHATGPDSLGCNGILRRSAPVHGGPALTDPAYHQHRQLLHALAEESGRLVAATVLDVGCGAKPYRRFFAGPYVGVDRGGEHGAPDVLAAAEELPLRSGAVDVVLSTQILEHVEDPARSLAEFHRVIRPGGTLLLSTHGVWIHHPDPHDYWRWTEEGLRRLVESQGFTIDRVHHQAELFLTGLLLASYPAAAATTSTRPAVRRAGYVLVTSVNLTGFVLEALARRLPRHYASIGYLVVARANDQG